MSARRFTTGQRFYWRDASYEVKRYLASERKVNVEDLGTGAVLLLEVQMLVDALFSGELRFEVEGRKTGEGKRESVLELSDYPPSQVEIARWRLEVIKPLLALGRYSEAEVRDRVEEVKARLPGQPKTMKTAVSCPSVYRWIRVYRRSGNDLRALLPQLETRGGAGRSRLNADVVHLVEAVINEHYLRPEKVTLDAIVQLTAARLEEENRLRPVAEKLRMPSRSMIERRVDALGMRARLEAKSGKRAARKAFTQYEQMDEPQLPLERVEIDHTLVDLILVDENDRLPLGRPSLTYSLDRATRYPLGYYLGFEKPSYYTVLECLYQTICPKENVREKYDTEHEWIAYGYPSLLVTDGGREFIGDDLAQCCELLGIPLQQCPVRTPEFKAGIERQFRTLNTGVFHALPGTTFSNIFERGDYDSLKRASLSLKEAEKALNLFIVDIYAERYHRGLKGIPARRWQNLTADSFSPRLPPGREELLILLGRSEARVIHHYGIDLERIRYNSPDLGALRAELRGEKAKIKYHPGDLSCIYVLNSFEKRYIKVQALDQEYTRGLSFWKHRVIKHFAEVERLGEDLAALGRARQKLQAIVDEALRRKRLATRSKAARWNSQPPSLEGQPSAPPALPAPQAEPAANPPLDLSEDAIYASDYLPLPTRKV